MLYNKIKSLSLLIFLTFGLSSCSQKNKNFSEMNYQEQLEIIKKNGESIRSVVNPSEEMRIAAIKQNGNNIKYLDMPNENEQLEAIKQNIHSLQYINNQFETVQLTAIKLNKEAIFHLKNPSENVLIEAIKNDKYSFMYLSRYSNTKVQFEAVKQDGELIKYIKNPSEDIKDEAQKHLENIRYTNGKILEFILSDKNLMLKVIDNENYLITNLTNQYINVKVVSFYYGDIVNNLNNTIIAPNSSIKIKFNNTFMEIRNNLKIVNFGFGLYYEIEGKTNYLYKINQYRLVDLLYKRS